jgi:nicotinate phosphoribosyltransferase
MPSVYQDLERDTGLATDLYELTMAQVYFDRGMTAPASFSLAVRSLPTDWGFFVFAGLDGVLDIIESFHVSPAALEYLASTTLFSRAFLEFLAAFRFSGDVHALPEGELFFPGEPLLEVTAPVIEAQIIETAVINRASLASLVASKAARSVLAAGTRRLVDFSARRTQSLEAGLTVARSSHLAGYAGTSNVLAAKRFRLAAYGTMAHSFITCFDHEIEAFRAYARSFPSQSVLLVDTYDTLAGVEKAITIARELERQGHRLAGVRLDSGDLADLSKRARTMLDGAGLRDAIIVASGGLNEHTVAALLAAGAPIDVFGIGTDLGVAADAPALDIAYKLVEYAGRPRLKLSSGKAYLAGRKQLYRRYEQRAPVGDLIATRDEPSPRREDWAGPLLVPAMRDGVRLDLGSLDEARARCRERLVALPEELRRLRSPAPYPVAHSDALAAVQEQAAGAPR